MVYLKQTEIKLALKKEKLNFKMQNFKLNNMEDSVTFIDKKSKIKIRGKVIRSFTEGEVLYWPLLNHENVAKLIKVLHICDGICICLTTYHEMTLKNIVHDLKFLYDYRCFDRKRSYAKGIFSGLSYLHEKSLTLMNLCDNNIIISLTDDRAIITNFENITISRKTEKSQLNIPEMYMAPETQISEFDASKAEVWASGILMLDMFLAHMVPWGFINYNPKNVIKIVEKLSLPIFQAANAGSIVSNADLVTFRTFLKCFLKQNPQDRMPAKYASTTSFLKNRYEYNIIENTCTSANFPEYLLTDHYTNFHLAEGDMTIFFSSINNPSFYSLSSDTLKTKIPSTNVNSFITKINDQRTKRSIQNGENEMEFDKSLFRTSKTRVKLGKRKAISSLLSSKYFIPTINEEIRKDFQKTNSWHSFDETAEFLIKPNFNFCQTGVKPKKNGNITVTSSLFSVNNSHYSNNKSSGKQPIECNFYKRFGLHWFMKNNTVKYKCDACLNSAKNKENKNWGKWQITKKIVKDEKNEQKCDKSEKLDNCIKRICGKTDKKEKRQNNIKKPKWLKFFSMFHERREEEQWQLLIHPL